MIIKVTSDMIERARLMVDHFYYIKHNFDDSFRVPLIIGYLGEMGFQEILESSDIPYKTDDVIERNYSDNFDFLVNNDYIDVKTSSNEKYYRDSFWLFDDDLLNKSQKKGIDYFVFCYILRKFNYIEYIGIFPIDMIARCKSESQKRGDKVYYKIPKNDLLPVKEYLNIK